jgi:Pyruvate/2-oxoacid:ferredoxin oxidoreductase delta subunit
MALCPSSQNEIGSLSTRHSLSVIASSSQSVIGLVSVGNFGSHKNGWRSFSPVKVKNQRQATKRCATFGPHSEVHYARQQQINTSLCRIISGKA